MTEAQVHFNQPEREYRRDPAFAQSQAKEILTSPAHFQARYGKDAAPFFPSAAMIAGTAIHCLTLEPELFDKSFYDRSEKPKDLTVAELRVELEAEGIEVPKGAKKADLEALLYPDGKPVDKRTSLDPETFADVKGAADALRAHDIAGAWFDPGQAQYRRHNEVSIYLRDEVGLSLKGRIDRLQLSDEKALIVDLKTTQSASPREFQRTAANLKYDLQAAWYHNLVSAAYPGKSVEFYFVAVERKRPYAISVFRASDALLESGRRKMRKALDLFAQCETLEYWPGYDPVIHELTLPGWAESGVESDEF